MLYQDLKKDLEKQDVKPYDSSPIFQNNTAQEAQDRSPKILKLGDISPTSQAISDIIQPPVSSPPQQMPQVKSSPTPQPSQQFNPYQEMYNAQQQAQQNIQQQMLLAGMG
jgi:hypothetical protein